MSAFFFTQEQLAALQAESPQQRVNLFAEVMSAGGLLAENGTFKIYPILIPGWHPVAYPAASHGVNADKTAYPEWGWQVVFPSYLSMNALDTIRLYMGRRLEPGQLPDPTDQGTLIKTIIVPQNHKNEDILGFIPDLSIERPGIHRMWYTIERKSGQPPEPSEAITVWFKPTFPDSLDPTGKTGERVLLEAPRFPAIIDEAMVEVGVDFVIPTWPIMTVGDVIALTVGNQIVEYTLKSEEVGQDIVIFVSSAILKLIGPAVPLLASYKVRDQVHNSSLTSKTGEGKLIPDVTYLEAPSVPDSINDVLKIDVLNGQTMKVEVFVERADAVAGDKVECFLYNPKTELTQSFGPLDYQRGIVTFEVPCETVKNLAPATIELYYERIRVSAGVEVRTPSYSYYPSLIGEKYRAPAPTAPQAHGAVLSPVLTETVVYAGPGIEGLAVGDKVTLTCLSTSAGGTTRQQIHERFVTQSMVIPGIGTVVPFDWETTHLDTYQNGSVRLSYTVTGIGHTTALESRVSWLRIDQVTNTLGIVDVGKDENGVLDPTDIPFGTPAICPAAAHTRVGDTVHLEVWTQDDDTLILSDSLPITADNAGKDLEFRLTLELIQPLLNRVISVDWYIERPRELPLTAPQLVLRIGAKALVLPPPELAQASPGKIINPLHTQTSATVKVSYAGMDPSHRVTLSAKGREGFGSPVLATLQGSSSGTLIFPLPLTAVPANMGTFMSFWYVVTQEGTHDQSSPLTKYEVTSIPNPEINYPRMSIAEAPDHKVLNLNNFTGDAHWTLPPWLFIAVGTRMRVALSGQKQDGSEYAIMLFDGVINASQVHAGLSGVINRAQLKSFKDGTQVFGLAIANFSDKGGADTFFPMRELTIKTEMLVRPVITQLIDNQGPITGQVKNGGSCDDPSPLLIGTATPNSSVNLFDGATSLGAAVADANGIWIKEVTVGLGQHSLTAETLDGLQVSLAWNVTVLADLHSVANFHNGNFNGWTKGAAALSGRLLGTAPNYLYHIHTPAKINNGGIIFVRGFNLIVGARYEFSCQIYNTAVNNYDVDPKIALLVDNMLKTPNINVYKFTGWNTLSDTFIASAEFANFYIHNHEIGDIGNDFYINNLIVEQLSN